MNRIYLISLLALAVVLAAAVSAYANDASNCYTNKSGCTTCTSCHAEAWDRTPIYVVPQGAGPSQPCAPIEVRAVDPWSKCGAFCYAGQVPQGWAYGWSAPYWMRPDSNF